MLVYCINQPAPQSHTYIHTYILLNGRTGVSILAHSVEKRTFREHGEEDHSVDKTESSKQTTERELGR